MVPGQFRDLGHAGRHDLGRRQTVAVHDFPLHLGGPHALVGTLVGHFEHLPDHYPKGVDVRVVASLANLPDLRSQPTDIRRLVEVHLVDGRRAAHSEVGQLDHFAVDETVPSGDIPMDTPGSEYL